MSKIVNGYIIEADKEGYYYHRTGGWIHYENSAMGYVWTEEEVEQILTAAQENAKDWELKPALLHPATYYAPVAGRVEINRPAYQVKYFKSPALYKGKMVNGGAAKFKTKSNLISVAVTL